MPETILNHLPPVKTPVRPGRCNPLAVQIKKTFDLKNELYGDPFLSLSEVAQATGEPCYATIRRWIKTGLIRTVRFGPRGHHRVRLSELRRFVGDQQPGVKP
jgi:hypothetical protein